MTALLRRYVACILRETKDDDDSGGSTFGLTQDVYDRIVDFLAGGGGKPIDDKLTHSLAGDLDMDPDELEAIIYAFASMWAVNERATVNPGGRAEKKGVSADDFDEDVIERGIKVELEHTRDRSLAKKIVLDHLAEMPDYYERLSKMEAGANK